LKRSQLTDTSLFNFVGDTYLLIGFTEKITAIFTQHIINKVPLSDWLYSRKFCLRVKEVFYIKRGYYRDPETSSG